MGNKDIVSKQVLRSLAAEIANILLQLDVDMDSVELLETEQQRIEQRRADLVARMQKRIGGESFILHVEIQNANQNIMAARMLRYFTDIHLAYPNEEIHQYLVYIGKKPFNMPDSIVQPTWRYTYNALDMHNVDCGLLLAHDTPEALVLAILCDFKKRPTQDVVNYIVGRLKALTEDDESSFRNYFSMLETLADNRDLQTQLDEAKTMITQANVKNFASYQWGVRDGEERGEERGIKKGREEGRKEGREEGREEGRLEIKRQLALSLLSLLDIETVSQQTGLSIEEIKALKAD